MALFRTFRVAALGLALTVTAAAQTAPQPSANDDEDLEVPAAPATKPPSVPAPQESSVPPAAPSPEPATKANSPTDAERIAELERRLAAVEGRLQRPAPPSPRSKTQVRRRSATARKLTPSPYDLSVPHGFAVGGYVQADYLHSQASDDQLQQANVPLNQNRFYLRRARLRLDRGWRYAAATLDLDANTVAAPVVGIRRAEGSLFYQGPNDAALPPLVMVTAGITDLPFGYELYEWDRTAPFTERSLVTSAIFPTKQDAGVKVSGAFSFLRYGFMVSNGEPVDSKGFPRDPNGAKDVTGRIGAVVPIQRAFEVTLGASFAVGKGFHPGRAATKGGLSFADTNGNSMVDSTELTPTPPQSAEPSKNFDRWAFGLDLGFRFLTGLGETHVWGEVIAASNYDRGFLLSDPTSGSDVRQLGGYAAFTQDVTRYGIVGFRASFYDPNADVLETRAGKLEPKTQTVRTLSPMVGFRLPGRGRLFFQYDFVRDYLGRDASGVPTDAKNDVYVVRLQVDL